MLQGLAAAGGLPSLWRGTCTTFAAVGGLPGLWRLAGGKLQGLWSATAAAASLAASKLHGLPSAVAAAASGAAAAACHPRPHLHAAMSALHSLVGQPAAAAAAALGERVTLMLQAVPAARQVQVQDVHFVRC